MNTKRILPLLAAGFVSLAGGIGEKTADLKVLPGGEPGKRELILDHGYRPEVVPGMLLMIAETHEEAEAAAELYGITLTSYENRLAVFTTDNDVFEVIEMGKKNGWPELSPNNVYHLDD